MSLPFSEQKNESPEDSASMASTSSELSETRPQATRTATAT